jgi:hypothetical protein
VARGVAGRAASHLPWGLAPGAWVPLELLAQGVGVAAAGLGLCFTALADLMKPRQLYNYKLKRVECSLYSKMQTYSADFFMTACFTLIVRRILVAIPIAGGGVIPAGGVVPATATVTAPVTEAEGADPTSSRSDSGGEAQGLQTDTVSRQQYHYLAIQQGSKLIPGRLDYLRFPLAHNPTTLQDQRQSFGQLHGWSGGVVPPRLPLSFLLRQGASTFSGPAAGQRLGYSSPLGFDCSAGEEVVRPRDVGLWRVTPVQLCVPLQKVFS